MPERRSPFTDRRDELSLLLKAMRAGVLGRGGMTLLLGDVGVGKTRLAEEASARIGLPTLAGRCTSGAAPFQPLREAFDASGLPFGARRAKAELEAVLLVDTAGELLAQVAARPELVEELGDLVRSMEQFLDQSMASAAPLEEFRYGAATVVVETLEGRRAIAVTRHRYLDLRSLMRRELESVRAGTRTPEAAVQAIARATLNEALAEEELLAERSRFFQQVLDSLLHLARQRGAPGTILVLDDLHDVDDDTFALLQYLLRRGRSAPIAVVGTARAGELGGRPGLQDGLRVLEREGLVQRIAVAAFPLEQVEELLALRFPGAVAPPLARELWDRTQGNLLFIEEYLATLEARGAIVRLKDGTWQIGEIGQLEIPAGIRELLLARLEGLRPEDGKVLEAAAIIATGITVPLIAAVARLPDGEVQSALERLVTAAVLVRAAAAGEQPVAAVPPGPTDSPKPAPPAMFAFGHPLTREVVLARVTQALVRRMHERAADALEALHGEERLFEVAEHARQGRDADRAVRAVLRAGDRAMATLAPQRAGRLYEEARALIPELPEAVRSSRGLELALRSARAAQLRGQVDAARLAATEAVALADSLGDRHAAAEAHEMLGWIATNQSRWAEATVHFTRCLESAKAIGYARGVLEGTRGVGKVLARQGRPGAARTYFEMCLEQAQAAGDRLEVARVLIDLGSLHRAAGDTAAARATYREGVEEAQRAGSPAEEARGHLNLASLASDLAEWPAAREEAERCLQAAAAAGDLRLEAFGTSCRGLARVGVGDLEGAERDLMQAVTMFTALDEKYPLGVAYRQLGRLFSRKKRPDRAKAFFDLAVVTLRPIGMPQEVGAAYVDLGRLFKEIGDHARAREYFREAVTRYAEAGAKAGAAEAAAEVAALETVGGPAPPTRPAADRGGP